MDDEIEPPIPRARTEGLVIRELHEEMLVYDLERHEAHCLNSVAAFIWEHCDGETSTASMAQLLAQKFGTPNDTSLVRFALEQLNRAHLLSVPLTPSAHQTQVSRRQVLRKIGRVAAVAVPLVTSIVAPTVSEAASCLGTGASCSSNAQCCSGLCVLSFCV